MLREGPHHCCCILFLSRAIVQRHPRGLAGGGRCPLRTHASRAAHSFISRPLQTPGSSITQGRCRHAGAAFLQCCGMLAVGCCGCLLRGICGGAGEQPP